MMNNQYFKRKVLAFNYASKFQVLMNMAVKNFDYKRRGIKSFN